MKGPKCLRLLLAAVGFVAVFLTGVMYGVTAGAIAVTEGKYACAVVESKWHCQDVKK